MNGCAGSLPGVRQQRVNTHNNGGEGVYMCMCAVNQREEHERESQRADAGCLNAGVDARDVVQLHVYSLLRMFAKSKCEGV